MPEFPETADSLIDRVRDPSNRAAWDQFEQIYRPVIFRIARSKGMQHADALDLVQQVMVSVASAINRYEKRDDGVRFRHWLSRITHNAIRKALSRQPRDRAAGGSNVMQALSELPAKDPETDSLIRLELRREWFRRATEQVRGDVHEITWLAFEMTTLQQSSIERVAVALDLSTGSVYAARSRVMRRIRDAVASFNDSDASCHENESPKSQRPKSQSHESQSNETV